ncbi:MAG: hypothetical protein E6Q97_19230 [Desulfurellales bacterium]|nr:MAG: hypothetical protein E6Q97_19230 [Desulfurellales bacterium]
MSKLVTQEALTDVNWPEVNAPCPNPKCSGQDGCSACYEGRVFREMTEREAIAYLIMELRNNRMSLSGSR